MLKLKPVHTSLIYKYSIQFHFYFSKSITEIIYNDTKSNTNNISKDIFAISDDTQFLNRMYHYYNSSGKEEIYDRIRLIGGFYNDNTIFCDYATMFVTNTVKIFKTRQRRLRKMIASDGSSDESEAQNQVEESFPQEGFLQSISSISSSSLDSKFKSIDNNISFQSETYNIYEDQAQVFQISSAKNICSSQESSISYLICDFHDIDAEKTLADYQLLSQNPYLKKKQFNNLTLTSISAKKPIYQSIIINENKNGQISHSNKYSRLLTQRNPAYISTSKVSKESHIMNYQDQVIEDKRKLTSREKYLNKKKVRKESHLQEMQERDWRRQKIRDKANQLLMRVKSQNYMSRHDYLKY